MIGAVLLRPLPPGRGTRHSSYGTVRVLAVLGRQPGWVHVTLPTRPNGSSGWVKAGDVKVEQVTTSIAVDLSARTITVLVGGGKATTGKAAVGSTRNPTPTGSFFVTDRVRPADPGGAYGSFALGLSAHSDTLSEFGGSDGQVGIHGTNDPASLGRAVSHGCVRVPDGVVALLRQVPLGTPVVVTA